MGRSAENSEMSSNRTGILIQVIQPLFGGSNNGVAGVSFCDGRIRQSSMDGYCRPKLNNCQPNIASTQTCSLNGMQKNKDLEPTTGFQIEHWARRNSVRTTRY